MTIKDLEKANSLVKKISELEEKLELIKKPIAALAYQGEFKIRFDIGNNTVKYVDFTSLGKETMKWLVSREKLRLEQKIFFAKSELEKL